ncbi:MAG: nucleotidyltransferase family protein [Pseudomonadota bacterium]
MAHALMLFAAGFGTRMGALTKTRPKPLIEVAGRPLINHALALIDAGPVSDVVINTHYLGRQIADHVAARPRTAISHETPEILETGGGLQKALPILGPDPVFTLNTDAVWTGPNPLDTLANAWDPSRMEALLLLVSPEAAFGHTGAGDFYVDSEERLTRGPGLIYAGTQILKTERLAARAPGKFSLNEIWNEMLAVGTLFGVVHAGSWCDVGRPDGIATAEAMLAGAQ